MKKNKFLTIVVSTALLVTSTLPIIQHPIKAEAITTDLPVSNVEDVWAGGNTNFFRTTDGKFYTFGANFYGESGSSEFGTAYFPKEITGFDSKVLDVKTIYNSETLFLTENGTVYHSGKNKWGQDGTSIIGFKGKGITPITLPGKAVGIALNETAAYALLENGDVYGWGSNANGELATGAYDTDIHTPTKITTGVVQIAANKSALFVRKSSNNGIYGVGWGQLGQSTYTTKRNTFVLIRADVINKTDLQASSSSQVVTIGGNVMTGWGNNQYAILGGSGYDGSAPTQISVGRLVNKFWLTDGGTLVYQIQNGEYHVLGANAYGQASVNNTSSLLTSAPYQLVLGPDGNPLTNIKKVVGGTYYSLILLDDGTLLSVGKNVNGSLGQDMSGANTSLAKPVKMMEQAPKLATFKITNVTETSITVSASLPEGYNDGAITLYNGATTGTTQTWSGEGVITKTFTGLTPNKPYVLSGKVITTDQGDGIKSILRRTLDVGEQAPVLEASPLTTDKTVSLTWEAASGATSYEIKRNNAVIATTTETNFEDTNVTSETEYTYDITAKNDGGNVSEPYKMIVQTLATPAPSDVTNFVDSAVTPTSVTLSWDTNPDAASYEVTRNGQVIYTGNDTQFVDNGLQANTIYHYSIVAINSHGLKSNPITLSSATLEQPIVIIPDPEPEHPSVPVGVPAAPSVSVPKIEGEQVQLSWNTVNNATKYEVKRNGTKIYEGNKTSYTDRNLNFHTSYRYEIAAINTQGKSDTVSKTIETAAQGKVTIMDNTPLYQMPSFLSPTYKKIHAGTYTAGDKLSIGNFMFYEIHTSTGNYYVDSNRVSTKIPSDEVKRLFVNKTARLFSNPDFSKTYKQYSIAPQFVSVVEEFANGWVKIKTWTNQDLWIYTGNEQTSPSPSLITHTVKKGETLYSIAKKYTGSGSNYKKVAKENGILNVYQLRVGQKLTITLH